MKTRLMYFALFILAVGIGLSACAIPPREVQLDVNNQRIDEAWEKAFNTATTLGYVKGQYDLKNKIVHFNRIEMDSVLPMNLHILMELDTTTDPDKPVLRMIGEDKETAAEFDQVEGDMKTIAEHVHKCCGVYMEIENEAPKVAPAPEVAPEKAPEVAPEEASEEVVEEAPEDTPEETPQDTPEETPEEAPEE